jgi:hypothetical protein
MGPVPTQTDTGRFGDVNGDFTQPRHALKMELTSGNSGASGVVEVEQSKACDRFPSVWSAREANRNESKDEKVVGCLEGMTRQQPLLTTTWWAWQRQLRSSEAAALAADSGPKPFSNFALIFQNRFELLKSKIENGTFLILKIYGNFKSNRWMKRNNFVHWSNFQIATEFEILIPQLSKIWTCFEF